MTTMPKHCPLMTIARSVAADQVVSHGACQGDGCAWWDNLAEQCCLRTVADGIKEVAAALTARDRPDDQVRRERAHG